MIPAPLDQERLRRVLWEMVHAAEHEGNGYFETCIDCMRGAEGIIVDLIAADYDPGA